MVITPAGLLIGRFVPVTPTISSDTVDNANSIFSTYKGDTTPVTSLSLHNKMLIHLSHNFIADWKMLGRMLGLSDANVYAIGRDHEHSITEQAMQMFLKWVVVNGSRATLGALTTAIYESGPPYWNLLEVMYDCLSEHIANSMHTQ